MVDFRKGQPPTLAAWRVTIFPLGWEDLPSGSRGIPSLTPKRSFRETLLVQRKQEGLKQRFSLIHQHRKTVLQTNVGEIQD